MTRVLLVAVVLTFALAGCGSDSLAEDDPAGYEACSLLAEGQKQADPGNKMESLFDAGKAANKASTKAIRESSKAMFDEDTMNALEDTPSAGQNFFLADADK